MKRIKRLQLNYKVIRIKRFHYNLPFNDSRVSYFIIFNFQVVSYLCNTISLREERGELLNFLLPPNSLIQF